MTITKLESDKLRAEIEAMKLPWYKRVESWVAIVAIISSLAGLGFQYSLHDNALLVARADRALAVDEKIKAENEKYFVLREKIALSEKLDAFEKDLKGLIEDHNKLIATTVPDAQQVKALVEANYKFLESIKRVQTQLSAAALPAAETRYLSWIDDVVSSIVKAVIGLLFLYLVYWFIEKKHPSLIPAFIEALKKKG